MDNIYEVTGFAGGLAKTVQVSAMDAPMPLL